MNNFTDIDQMLEVIKNDIAKAMHYEGEEEIKNKYKETAEESYEWYEPKHPDESRYRRNESGSFADDENYMVSTTINGNTVTTELVNLTPSETTGDLIVDCVEEGLTDLTDYTITKKPVAETTIDKIKNEKIIENILDKYFK